MNLVLDDVKEVMRGKLYPNPFQLAECLVLLTVIYPDSR